MAYKYEYICIACLSLFLLLGCDEGKIYPDNTVDSGRTASVTISFSGLRAWPRKNMLAVAAFGSDSEKPTLVKRLSRPSTQDRVLEMTLNNLEPGTQTIEIVVLSNGQRLIYSYYSYPVDDSMDAITIDVGSLELGSFDRIQKQVFEENCLSCHGGSTSGAAGELNLQENVAYKALVNVKAPLSEEGKNYVTPGDLDNSFLLDVLDEHSYHADMFNSSGKEEVLGLIEAWILDGAKDN